LSIITVWLIFIIVILVFWLIGRSRQKNQKKCPFCGRMIPKDADNCPYCGKGLSEVCPYCKMPLEPNWGVCPYCGKKVERRRLV